LICCCCFFGVGASARDCLVRLIMCCFGSETLLTHSLGAHYVNVIVIDFQWLKYEGMRGTAVPPPLVFGSNRSPTLSSQRMQQRAVAQSQTSIPDVCIYTFVLVICMYRFHHGPQCIMQV